MSAPAIERKATPPKESSPTGDALAATVFKFRWWILVGLWAAGVMEVLDTTIVNVAMPQMAGNLSATSQEIAWVSIAYVLANVVVLPMTAFLADRFGRKRYLLASIVLFLIASLFCGTSHSLGELIFWRILQGAGGAALLSTAQATIRQIFPPAEIGITQAIFLLGIVVAPTLGPTLGGWITDNYTWSWVFFVNLPVGALSLFFVATFLHDAPRPKDRAQVPVDWLGIGLLTVGLSTLQYVLEEGNKDDWFESGLIVNLSILAAASLVGLIWWQLSAKNRHPVIDLRILKNRELSASLILFLMLGFGLYGGIYLFPIFTQGILHFTPTETGLALLPGGIATSVAVIICGRALGNPKAKVDPRVLIVIGLVTYASAMWMLGHLTTQTGKSDTELALIVRGLGLGFLFVPLNLVAFATLRPDQIQQASGLINLVRQLGGSFGIAVLGTYLANQTHFHQSRLGESINAANPLVIERQTALAQRLLEQGYTASQAQAASLGILARSVATQAQTMAFNDAFLLLLLATVVAAPSVLLLRRPKAGPRPAPGGH